MIKVGNIIQGPYWAEIVEIKKCESIEMTTLYERSQKYQTDDVDHRNSALINQTISQIKELEERCNERLEEIERECSIQL